MPTNFLRTPTRPDASATRGAVRAAGEARLMRLTAGRVVIDVELADTASAALLWAALPLRSAAEPWGETLHFELPVRMGRDRGARINGRLGDVYYWPEQRRIMVPFGATPISRPGEIRLPQPLNVVGRLLGQPEALRAVRTGEMVALERMTGR
ncbi:MAG: cyclophilin-like family protein, partial [Hyphomicrobiaceae bacterium]